MLAKDILKKARYALSDTARDRWTDERLLELLNDAIIDIAKNTTLFVENMFYEVSNLVVDIDLSDRALKIVRAEYLDEPLPFYTFEEMEYKNKEWQLETGTEVKALIYDKQRNALVKQYPIVSNVYNPYIEYNQLLGVTTDISYSDIQPILADVYGDISHIPDIALIKFYYIRKHEKITDINSELEIDDLVATPIVHYITGKAFRDNQDTQNRNLGNEELTLYYNMVEEYNIQKSQLFVRTVNEARYRPND